jgi:hypothetical protein
MQLAVRRILGGGERGECKLKSTKGTIRMFFFGFRCWVCLLCESVWKVYFFYLWKAYISVGIRHFNKIIQNQCSLRLNSDEVYLHLRERRSRPGYGLGSTLKAWPYFGGEQPRPREKGDGLWSEKKPPMAQTLTPAQFLQNHTACLPHWVRCPNPVLTHVTGQLPLWDIGM